VLPLKEYQLRFIRIFHILLRTNPFSEVLI
jgi:hypothetical protein